MPFAYNKLQYVLCRNGNCVFDTNKRVGMKIGILKMSKATAGLRALVRLIGRITNKYNIC